MVDVSRHWHAAIGEGGRIAVDKDADGGHGAEVQHLYADIRNPFDRNKPMKLEHRMKPVQTFASQSDLQPSQSALPMAQTTDPIRQNETGKAFHKSLKDSCGAAINHALRATGNRSVTYIDRYNPGDKQARRRQRPHRI